MQLITEIESLKPKFSEIASLHKAVDFSKECLFAKQALENNDYLMKAAVQNKQSLFDAILNVASIGISLNPALKRAYLVPRGKVDDKKIVLDLSYMGLCHLAQESGSVLWVQAELVYLNDEFIFNGMGEKPTHKFNPFDTKKDRGEFIGAYCVAKLHNGDFLTTMMNDEEIDRIKERSDSWRAYKSRGTNSMWVTDFGEMAKKTVVKRASKMWPKNDRINRIDEAIDYDNSSDELPVDEKFDTTSMDEKQILVEEIKELLRDKCKGMSDQEKGILMVNKCKVRSFNDLITKKTFELQEIIKILKTDEKTFENK